MKNRILAMFLWLLLGAVRPAQGMTWMRLDYPGAVETRVYGIDGGTVVGAYYASAGWRGFIYDGETWFDYQSPLTGIDGRNAIGNNFLGILYNLDTQQTTTFGMIATPLGGRYFFPHGISGSNIIGQGFGGGSVLYNSETNTYLPLMAPGSSYTTLWGIDGDTVVGAADGRGVLYHLDSQTWTFVDVPGCFVDIDGNTLVGNYKDYENENGQLDRGFLFDGSEWTPFDIPGALGVFMQGIDGTTVVGFYDDTEGTHGFIATIPEPATVLLLGLGMALGARQKHSGRQ